MALAILCFLALMTVLNVVLTVTLVGKPRQPINSGTAAGVSFVGMLYLLAYVYLGTQV